MHTWSYLIPAVPDADVLAPKWQRILAVRAAVLRELEQLRMQGRIGSSLQADVTVSAPEPEHAALASLGDDLKYVFITSAARVERGDALAIAVNPSAGTKCERCRNWTEDVGADAEYPTICARCAAAVRA